MKTITARATLRKRLSHVRHVRSLATELDMLRLLTRSETRLERAITYLNGRLHCKACGNPDCPKTRACANPYWRECPAD